MTCEKVSCFVRRLNSRNWPDYFTSSSLRCSRVEVFTIFLPLSISPYFFSSYQAEGYRLFFSAPGFLDYWYWQTNFFKLLKSQVSRLTLLPLLSIRYSWKSSASQPLSIISCTRNLCFSSRFGCILILNSMIYLYNKPTTKTHPIIGRNLQDKKQIGDNGLNLFFKGKLIRYQNRSKKFLKIQQISMQNFPLDPKKADQDHDDKYNQVMKGMFLQISQSLLSMLKNLKYIYEAHGILYRIDHLHSVMLNMLMPPQLVSFLHFWCPDQTFREEAFKVLEPFKNWQINSKKNEIKKAQPKQNSLPLQVEKQSIDIAKNKQEQRKIEIKGSEAMHVQEMGEDEQTLRMLQYNSDNELYEWIVQEVNRGHKLKRLDIIRKAMSIGKITRLQGSSQWCDQFLARYPTLKKNLTTVDDESQKKQEQNKKSIQGQQILVSKTQFNQSILRENEQSKMDQEPKSEINQDGLKKKLNQLWSQDIYQNEIIQEQKIDLKAKWLQESYKGVDSNYYLPFERSLAIGDEQKQASSQPNIKFQKNQAQSQNHDSRLAQRNQMKNEDGNEMGKESKLQSAVNDAQEIVNDFAQMSRSHKPKRVRDVAGRYYQ